MVQAAHRSDRTRIGTNGPHRERGDCHRAVGTTIVGIAAGITGWMFWGALVLTILVVFDSLDGSVAAITTGGTKFGRSSIPHSTV